jgi:hypothetical protein
MTAPSSRAPHARSALAACLLACAHAAAGAQPARTPAAPVQRVATAELAPALAPLVAPVGGAAAASELRDVVERYSADRGAILRRYDVATGMERHARLGDFYRAWQARLREVDFDRLAPEGRIDYVLLAARLRYELALLDREAEQGAGMRRYARFLDRLTALQEARRRMGPIDAAQVSRSVDSITKQVEAARVALERAPRLEVGPAGTGGARGDSLRMERIVAYRAANALDQTRRGALASWYGYYAGYDPAFTWWMRDPYKRLDDALAKYVTVLRDRVIGWKAGEEEPIIGDAVGAEGLRADLEAEMIPYTPRELIAIAEKEYAWCLAEMKKASREMGFGDDWKKALEKVKNSYVEPGRQTDLVRDLAFEATEFVESRGLVTVPPLAKEVWRMEMMSPERQRVAPFFLGGEVILVSYPTDAMETEDKLMSLRGNNPHFSRAVAHHELIPGHHLQGFMAQRYNAHRGLFGTPFWSEGNALWWEMLLWDRGFARSPEDRVGMLFWRMHRTQRIIFSLSVHLGTMTPQQAVDLLVENVGHERANAEGEVRRSFNGSYPPVYQAAYMLGALQFRALHTELVGGGKMTDRQFHDAILQGGRMPVEMVRASLLRQALPRDYTPRWRFYGDPIRKSTSDE